MKIYKLDKLSAQGADKLCQRKAINFDMASKTAKKVIKRVRLGGDKALREITKEFDGVEMGEPAVSADEIKTAVNNLEIEAKQALDLAAKNIEKFHSSQAAPKKATETMPGVMCFSEPRPIEKIGLYIPGGTAPLPSTVLMLAIPAKLAGCKDVVLCTPPNKDGSLDDSILYAAYICGVDKIYKLGGAQAVAAMAYGTKNVPKVYKIFGPGNQYVTAAKMLVSIDKQGAAIDMPAGPTELLVVADEDAPADFVAADLLSQAEHGPDSQVVLICTSNNQAQKVLSQLEKQSANLPRKEIVKQSLKNSFILIVKNLDAAVEFSNKYAPEHLILNTKSPEEFVPKVVNAGSVFLGRYSCESAGDYASGTNHSLPTYGYARAYSGVSVASFQKQVTFQSLTAEGVKNVGPIVAKIAGLESLEAHKRAMEIRMEEVK